MGERNINVALCGLVGSHNLGEAFIADTLEYLLTDEMTKKHPDVTLSITQVDILKGRDEGSNLYDRIYVALDAYKNHANLYLRNMVSRIRHFCWQRSDSRGRVVRKELEQIFSDKQVIVIDGAGLLEYSFNEYQEMLLLISRIAEKKHIPIIYNAVGTAGDFELKDYRCKLLQSAMRSKAILYVSARDSLKKVQRLVGKRLSVRRYCDAAICMSDAYGIEPIEKSKRNVIGIGLIRGGALRSYHTDFSTENWVNLFAGIGKELGKRGYEYRFFTNGLETDYGVGEKVIRKLHLSRKYLVDRPEDARILAKTIGEYSAMITCRMHSVIAGMSLQVPSVALSWNKKIDKYMNYVGTPERAIDYKQFSPKYIVDCLEKALQEDYSVQKLDQLKEHARNSVRDYIDMIAGLVE